MLPQGAGPTSDGSRLNSRLERQRGNGQTLPAETLRAMNNALGSDFSPVRIHADAQAADLSQSLQAKAFTHGSDIFFNAGQYQPQSREGKRLLAHELTHVVQQGGQARGSIQRDDKAGAAGGGSSFDFDFDLLPPDLKLRVGGLMLHADTGAAELRFAHNLVRYRLGYSYGSDIYLGSSSGRFGSRLGFNPSAGSLSLGLSHGDFRFGSSLSPGSGGVGFNLGFGAPLLPMPDALSGSIAKGWGGASGILGGLSDFSDPLSFYRSQEENIDAVMGAVKAVTPLAASKNRRFGAGLRFTYNPSSGVLVHAGMQWFF